MSSYSQLIATLKREQNPGQAAILQRFFKTGKGEYGEGDVFLGIKVPVQRKIVKKYLDLSLRDIQKLMNSKIHEHRMVGLLIIVYKYEKADDAERDKLYNFYIKNSKKINNWDLVDVTAPHVVGRHLLDKSRKVLYTFARSKNLWQKRIAILSTFPFIRKGEFTDTLKIAEILLHDEHDLMHKAVGWMLREVGKRDQDAEERFLKKHRQVMPRTMLRYAIERFSERKRKWYLDTK